ncbi:MAG TPA: hypothetical protein VGM10_21710 [Actinocrinis sp.]
MAEIPRPRARGRAGGRGFALVDGFAGRRSIIPFAVLVLAVLGLGLILLLMVNTALDKGAFTLQSAQQRGTQLTDEEQQLQLELSATTAPSALASQAAALGMVPNPQPAFLNPADGSVLGSPTPAPTTAKPTPSPSTSAAPSPSVAASSSPSTTTGTTP